MPPEILSPQDFENLLSLHAASNLEYTSSSDTPLIRLLATIDREQLSQLMTEQRYQPGEIVCWEDDAGDAMYLAQR